MQIKKDENYLAFNGIFKISFRQVTFIDLIVLGFLTTSFTIPFLLLLSKYFLELTLTMTSA
jgi:hypothetical protein